MLRARRISQEAHQGPFISLRPTQPSTLSGPENEYRPKCGDALRLGRKGRYGSFHLWINVWVAGRTVRSLVNTIDEQELIRRRDSERELFYKIAHVVASAYAH